MAGRFLPSLDAEQVVLRGVLGPLRNRPHHVSQPATEQSQGLGDRDAE